MSSEGRVVVLGGGIIGASIAYHLALRGVIPIVIEEHQVGCAASGHAGGFMAETWGDGSSTEKLHRVSFAMHKELVKTLNIESYRPIEVLQVTPHRKQGDAEVLATWLDGSNAKHTQMDTDERCAQVTPLELTQKLMDEAIRLGGELIHAKVCGIEVGETESSGKKHATAVKLIRQGAVNETTLPCGQLVAAMGPWSVLLEDWLGVRLPLEGIWSTSMLFKHQGSRETAIQREPFALFTGEDRNGCHVEVYPRPDGSVYVCGCGGSVHISTDDLKAGKLPPSSSDNPNMSRVSAAMKSLSAFAPTIVEDQTKGDGEREAHACMRPCAPDALPVMGEVPCTDNVFVCCGHNCWGITWAPVSGKAMSELMLDGTAECVDLNPFSLWRFNQHLRTSRKSAGRGGNDRDTRSRKKQGDPVGERW